MPPCTLHGPVPGRMGRIKPRAGRMKVRGAGDRPLLISMGCTALGRIGSIGRMFVTYARARGCGVHHAAIVLVKRQERSLLARSPELSSLSSPSSLKGCFQKKNQWLGKSPMAENILPEIAVILPILPVLLSKNQHAVSNGQEATKYRSMRAGT